MNNNNEKEIKEISAEESFEIGTPQEVESYLKANSLYSDYKKGMMANSYPPPLLPRFRLSDELIAKIEEAKKFFEKYSKNRFTEKENNNNEL